MPDREIVPVRIDAGLNPTGCEPYKPAAKFPANEEVGVIEMAWVAGAIIARDPANEEVEAIETASELETISPSDPRIDESGVIETAAEAITINATEPISDESGVVEMAWLAVNSAATSPVSEDSVVNVITWLATIRGYLRVTMQAPAARSTVSAAATTLDEFSGPTTSRLPPEPSSQIP